MNMSNSDARKRESESEAASGSASEKEAPLTAVGLLAAKWEKKAKEAGLNWFLTAVADLREAMLDDIKDKEDKED